MTPMTNPNDFLAEAPVALVNLLSQTSRGKDILRRLLTDPRMKRSWVLLGKRCSGTWDYIKLWNEIVYVLLKIQNPEPSRAKKRKHFLGIAKDAEKLASTITDGPLDRLTFEFFPENEAHLAFKADNWAALGVEERLEVARLNLAWWPSMTGVLEEVARHAKIISEKAVTEKRTVYRETYDRQINFFIRHLARYFRTHLDGPMEGTLGNIASVVFKRQFDKKFVRQALRHEKGGA